MTSRTHCICSAPLKRLSFSEHFDALTCGSCASRHFVAAQNGAAPITYNYDGDNEKYAQRDYLYGKQLRWAHAELLKRDWTGRKVLEIGCFNGFFLDELKKKGAQVYGFDVNRDALAVGEELFGLSGRLESDMAKLAQNGPFDDIICVDVLEHLEQPENLLSEVSALLVKGGRLVIAGPTIERRFHDKSDYPPHHAWWFSTPGLKSLLSHAAFDVASVDIQRDGLLLLRNFIGKVGTGLSKREFYGEAALTAPNLDKGLGAAIYAVLSKAGAALFTVLRIPYCSVILTATKSPTA